MAIRRPNYSRKTEIVHGTDRGRSEAGDLVPPIHMTSAFEFKNADHGAALFAGEKDGYIYTRIANPTVGRMEAKIARLEKCAAAVATGSGMAAIAAVALTLAKPGDNFVASTTLYGGTFNLFTQRLRNFGIEARLVPPEKANSRQAITSRIDARTRFLFMETPANPTLDIIDIAVWAGAARTHNAACIVDNTFATPYLQNPATLGADIVVHSATKYIGGHADVIGGVITGSREMMSRIREEYLHSFGPVMSPFNAWLFLRGLKTLAIRMEKHCENARQVADWLQSQRVVRKVYYPGLATHPNHQVAKTQMRAFGGMLAFEVKGGIQAGKTIMDKVRLCRLAVSLGDCETLIQHPASMTHSTYSRSERLEAGINDGLIRLSVGIENPVDIESDLEGAFKQI